MTWLFIPPQALTPAAQEACSAYRCAPAPEDSTSDLCWPNPDTAVSVTSSGTPSPRPSSWRGWKRKPWIRLLSGMTLQPSTAAHGAASWIASVRAIRVSLSASPVGVGERTTPGTCGRTSRESSANANPNGVSSRTSPITSTSDIAKSEASWKAWATALRKDSLRRRKSARRIAVSGCSSWPTPNVGGGGNPPEILIRKGNHFVRPSGKKAHLGLDQAARMWPTPRACSGNRSSGCNRTELINAWATPMASDGTKPSGGKRRGADLTHQAKNWTADCRPSRPAPTTGTDGNAPSASGLTLNPRFVEALMGWPIGWTGFDCVATEWCHWLRRMRGKLSKLDLIRLETDTL